MKAAKALPRSPSAEFFAGNQNLILPQALDMAVQHLMANRLSEAESIFRQILKKDPNLPDALHFLGVIAHQKGKGEIAIDLIRRALTIAPDYMEAHNKSWACL